MRDSATISCVHITSSPVGFMRARSSGAAAHADRDVPAASTRTSDAVIALPSIVAVSDLIAAAHNGVAEHSPLPGIEMIELRRWRVELDRACSSAAHCRPTVLAMCNAIVDDVIGTAALRQLVAACFDGTSSARNAYPAFSMPFGLHGAGHMLFAGTLCASQRLVRSRKGDETSSERGENNEKTKAKRKRFALRYLRQMMCPPWNKPKAVRPAWQARRSPLLGRRTGAERLYSDDGHHRDGARLATFARTRIRGFEEVLRARDGRA
ncbi:hypothetical protein [Bradyrhizobium acaciae]|uniref:hypothetical protein n=1 Tax=Bradyrhizobium acaciae TaxID=2683706 RepID=UPI001E599117|nr:hypothetical protein [Bradyrhizobium acaciae]MCC8980595.1 hypothetical protein [Bradyrhizobium acaciae]